MLKILLTLLITVFLSAHWSYCRHHNRHHHHIGIKNNSSLLQLSSDFTQITTACDENADCVTCVNEDCYPRVYASLLKTDTCPIVACDSVNCTGYATWSDHCPICLCPNNVGTRNPCNSTSDCDPASSTCQNNLCTYENLPAGLPAFCTMDNECPADQSCSNSTCVQGTGPKHAENISCIFTNNCPSGFYCDRSRVTCYQSSVNATGHIPNRQCMFRYDCPDGYDCSEMTCFEDRSGVKHLEGVICVFSEDCDDGYRCEDMTCVRGSDFL